MISDEYDVFNTKTGRIIAGYSTRKDAELWIAEQENPEDFEIVEATQCSSPMNLFLAHGNLTRNKK